MGDWHVNSSGGRAVLYVGDSFKNSITGMSESSHNGYYLWAGWGTGGLPAGSHALIAANSSGVEIANLTANGPTTINKIANTIYYSDTALGKALDNIYNSIFVKEQRDSWLRKE